jgi:hypothetical protein
VNRRKQTKQKYLMQIRENVKVLRNTEQEGQEQEDGRKI